MQAMSALTEYLNGIAGPQLVLQIVVAAGFFVAVLGIAASLAPDRAQQVRRIRAVSAPAAAGDIVRPWDNDPTGVLRLFVPLSGRERGRITARIRQAGIHRPDALRRFFLVRSSLAIVLPGAFLGAVWWGPALPPALADRLAPLARLEMPQVFLIAVLLLVAGFYGPSVWLSSRVEARRKAIARGMPGALDLMQVAIEAGLGFDAAMNRVARDFGRFCGPIAEEFTILQLEIQAGKPREQAMAALERRTGVDAMASFANVVQQSAEFGTPLSQALESYAADMRLDRELKAQAKANQLPVKMSAVLAGFMMPILLLTMLTPIAIRWFTVLSN